MLNVTGFLGSSGDFSWYDGVNPCGMTTFPGAWIVKLVRKSVRVNPEYDEGFVIVKTTKAFRDVFVGLKLKDGMLSWSCCSAGKNWE